MRELYDKLGALLESGAIAGSNEALVRVTTGGAHGLITGVEIAGDPIPRDRIISKHTIAIGEISQ